MSRKSKIRKGTKARYETTPEQRCRTSVDNFRRARIEFINDLDSDYEHSRDDMNRMALRRKWRKLQARFASEGRDVDLDVLGSDRRVHDALGIEFKP